MLGRLWKVNKTSRNEKNALYERVVIPTVIHGFAGQQLYKIKGKVEVFDMTRICGVRRSDRGRNSSIRERCS